MKILTTQNLNSLAIKENSTNNSSSIPNEIRYNFLLNKDLMEPAEINSDAVSFKAKKPSADEIKKVLKLIEEAKRKVGEIAKEASPEVKRWDELKNSPLFKWALGVADYETVVQSTIAAVACALRALTIVGMSNEENKGNNAYAAGHALASGIVGFITVFALTAPFKAGADHVFKVMFKDLKETTLKRLHPQLDETSIVDAAGKRLNVDQWKDTFGNKFSTEIKNCDMLPKFRPLSEMSEASFEKVLNVSNVDWAKFKDKSFNQVITNDGEKLAKVIDFNKLGIIVEHTEVSAKTGKEVVSEGQILFRDMDKDYFTDLVSKMKEDSPWKQLDIESAFEEVSKDKFVMKHFDEWKKLDGNNFELDLDAVYASSPLETCDYSPRISGALRKDLKEGVNKFRTYQRNGENGKLGSEITDDMLKADKESAGLIKSLTWLPDLIFRVPIAMTTVAMIPWILKTVFGVEKQKSQPKVEENKQQEILLNKPEVKAEAVTFKGNQPSVNADVPETPETNENVSFKAGAPKKPGLFNKMLDKIGEFMAKLYGKPLIESETMAKISAKLANVPGGLTQAMATFGALLTSATYVTRTLNNKELEEDKKRTLAVNQTLCWIVPTIAAYSVDKLINNWVKKNEYRFSGIQQHIAEKLRIDGKPEEAKAVMDKLSKNVKGVRILASLATFTLIYRYATPVLITPLANKIGNWANARRAEKQAAEKEAQTAKVA